MGAIRRVGARLRRNRSGAAAVEFAIVAPLLLAVLFGVIAFGSFLGFAHTLQTIASESARAAIAGLDQVERASLASAAAQRSIDANPLIKRSAVRVDVGTSAVDPDLFTVTLHYDLSTSVLGIVPRLLPLPTTLSRTASIRRGGL